MTGFLIVIGCFFAYFVMAGITAKYVAHVNKIDTEHLTTDEAFGMGVCGAFWPAVLPFLLGITVFNYVIQQIETKNVK